ncbi:MAG: hypothetical protein OMM_04288 [Candidatus Magnetoglobus multicellularis str. Araruama]|uniref:Peptidase C13, legumain n=1 Tax=Candidatus Magnetoglobus multicellularis str. Araruama TaxID=890399 RepID=A0A1V1P2D0_9BACT|nr:MAG: hypothetical protein OMM_04288 [Candidatus Magnetoglobus multicellularis str. Araruama]
MFIENDQYKSSSDSLVIDVVETAGYAIIIQGKIKSNEGLASHNKTANFVYQQLTEQRGLLDEDIFYFNYDTNQPGVDAKPSKQAIQQTFTQDIIEKMNFKPANLYIIMVDHGTKEKFYIDPETITSSEFSEWTDTLQDGLTGQAMSQEIVFVLGFCFSGSFIDELSGQNRVVISSSGPDEFSYKGPLDEDNIREGEYFVSEFFKQIVYGKSVKQSFAEAVVLTEKFTAKGFGSINAPPYYDDSDQHPLLDDNADKVGTNDVMISGDEGLFADKIFIGVNPKTHNDIGDVYIKEVAKTIYLGENETATNDLWAEVSDPNQFVSLWIEIKYLAKDYKPVTALSGQIDMDLEKIVYNPAHYENGRYFWKNIGPQFIEPGIYQVFYFAKDRTSKNVSPLVRTYVYKNRAGNRPPKSISGDFTRKQYNNVIQGLAGQLQRFKLLYAISMGTDS